MDKVEDTHSDSSTGTQTALPEESDEGATASSGAIALAGGRQIRIVLVRFILFLPLKARLTASSGAIALTGGQIRIVVVRLILFLP